MAENQLAKAPQTGLAKLKASLNAPSVQEQFRNALKENSNLFIASIIDLYNGDKSLQKCTPNAIISEALKAAVLDLPINRALGFAYIVVYNNTEKYRDEKGIEREVKVPTPTFIPGYKGYIQLAMRTGQYLTINADFVYEGELRQISRLSGEVSLDGERTSDKIVGYFCHFKLLNGYTKTLYMSVEEMARHAKRYAPGIKKEVSVQDLIKKANDGYVSKQVGWMGNFNDMALKTVIRRLISKYGYLSIKMQNALAHDNESDQNRALAARNESLQISNEQTEVITLENTEYEEVDKETGEVMSAPESESPAQEPTPDY